MTSQITTASSQIITASSLVSLQCENDLFARVPFSRMLLLYPLEGLPPLCGKSNAPRSTTALCFEVGHTYLHSVVIVVFFLKHNLNFRLKLFGYLNPRLLTPLQYLFDSTKVISVLPCGHTIHMHCLKEMHEHLQ